MWNDLRLSARLLLKERWFALAAAGALALGIAANTTMYTIVYGIMLRPLPFPGAERTLLLTTENTADRRARFNLLSAPELRDWRAAARTFDDIAGYSPGTMNLSDDSAPAESLDGVFVSGNSFTLLDERPHVGRTFRDDDDRPGAASVVVLGYAVWQKRYSGDPAVVGRTVRVNGVPATVIGVMRDGFAFPSRADIWMPMARLSANATMNRQARAVTGFGRLRTGVTIEQADADLTAVAGTLARQHPETNASVIPRLRPFRASSIGAEAGVLFGGMMGAVAFVLLIACANVANLLLARGARRARDISVRLSLGATRGRIVRQLLIESLLLALTAGVVGLALSFAGVKAFTIALEGQAKPYWMTVAIDAPTFVFFAGVCLATTLLFGLLPALNTSRANIAGVLSEAGRGHSTAQRSRRWAGALVVVQLALTLVLLAGAGLSIRDLTARVGMNVGVDTSRITVAQLVLPPAQYGSAPERAAFYERLDEQLAGLPVASAVASAEPLGGGLMPGIGIDGRDPPQGTERPSATYLAVGPRYFSTLGAGAVRGREFTATDRGNVAIVNQRFAGMYFAGQDPIGRRIRIEATANAQPSDWLTIVGVAPNIRQQALDGDVGFDPVVYRPYGAVPLPFATLLAYSTAGTTVVATELREAVRAIDRDLPLWVISLDRQLARNRVELKLLTSMLGIFGGIGLLLASLGVYAVTAYAVAQRTHEIGLRIALGAQSRQLWWLVSRRAVVHLAIGLAVGMPGAWAAGQIIQSELDAISPSDPLTYASVPATLVLVMLAACLIPARRAMRLNPIAALRN